MDNYILHFILQFNPDIKRIIYQVIAENRCFNEQEWNEIVDSLAQFKKINHVNDIIAGLMESLPEQEKQIFVSELNKTEFGRSFTRKLFIFEDIIKIDRHVINKALSVLPLEDIAIALIGASPNTKNFLLDLSNKKNEITTIMSSIGSVQIFAIEDAQKRIINEILAAQYSSEE